MKYNTAIFVVLLTISVQFAHAQLSKGKYIIFTFEYINNNSPHGTQIYYWIQSVDSLSQQQPHLDKLLLSGYSISELQDCCSGKSINPYTGTNTNSYEFGNKYYMSIDTISFIIRNSRKKIKSIHKTIKEKNNDLLNIYITPVEGVFCSSKFSPIRDKENLYKGLISIPYSSFCFYKNFWKSEEYRFIKNSNYLKFMYSILPPNRIE